MRQMAARSAPEQARTPPGAPTGSRLDPAVLDGPLAHDGIGHGQRDERDRVQGRQHREYDHPGAAAAAQEPVRGRHTPATPGVAPRTSRPAERVSTKRWDATAPDHRRKTRSATLTSSVRGEWSDVRKEFAAHAHVLVLLAVAQLCAAGVGAFGDGSYRLVRPRRRPRRAARLRTARGRWAWAPRRCGDPAPRGQTRRSAPSRGVFSIGGPGQAAFRDGHDVAVVTLMRAGLPTTPMWFRWWDGATASSTRAMAWSAYVMRAAASPRATA